ncbi:MAG: hypothetical protein ACREJO_17460, partial [Phycisphaerales bacterium]
MVAGDCSSCSQGRNSSLTYRTPGRYRRWGVAIHGQLAQKTARGTDRGLQLLKPGYFDIVLMKSIACPTVLIPSAF